MRPGDQRHGIGRIFASHTRERFGFRLDIVDFETGDEAGAGEDDGLQEVALGADRADLGEVGADVTPAVADGVAGVAGGLLAMEDDLDPADVAGREGGQELLELGLLPGRVRRFSDKLVVPHVGWNQVRQRNDHPLFHGVNDHAFFYFVHSYYFEPAATELVLGETDYGFAYASVVARGNLCGVQFHPEKSQAAGLQLLSNFAKYDKLKFVDRSDVSETTN